MTGTLESSQLSLIESCLKFESETTVMLYFFLYSLFSPVAYGGFTLRANGDFQMHHGMPMFARRLVGYSYSYLWLHTQKSSIGQITVSQGHFKPGKIAGDRFKPPFPIPHSPYSNWVHTRLGIKLPVQVSQISHPSTGHMFCHLNFVMCENSP